MYTEEKLKELFETRKSKEGLMRFIKSNTEAFSPLLQLSLKNTPEAWRASWLIGHAMTTNDTRVQGAIDSLIEALPSLKEGHQRQTIIILLKMQLDDEQEGKLFDICLNIWENIKLIPSTRITAMKFILSIVDKFTELKDEIKLWTQEQYTESLSPGIKHSLNKQIHKILES
ncbi:hypothetical protein [Flavicella sp.]|uniref:hypothetical protein n=1 Tax=Flavicella sp. TaxID=2957742 RepID=UPI00260B3281|nr:hypothetical protein [Flavicella sp.]MDG1804664.1 hypothetical protein [Flavicella sp.]